MASQVPRIPLPEKSRRCPILCQVRFSPAYFPTPAVTILPFFLHPERASLQVGVFDLWTLERLRDGSEKWPTATAAKWNELSGAAISKRRRGRSGDSMPATGSSKRL